MVTLCPLSNPAEAAFAKPLPDDRDILCSVADENAFFYGGLTAASPHVNIGVQFEWDNIVALNPSYWFS